MGKNYFLLSPKYVSNCTCHCLTVGLMFPVPIMPAYLSSNIIRYVRLAHWIRDLPRQASIFTWSYYYILEEEFFVLVGCFQFYSCFLKQIWLDCFNTHSSLIFSLFQWLQYYWEADGSPLLVSCHPDRMMDVNTWKIFILLYIALRCFPALALKVTHSLAYALYGSSLLCVFFRLNIAHTHSATTSHFVSYFFPLYFYAV